MHWIKTYRTRSIPFHSRTVICQKPRINAREAVVEEMVKINSANSDASACCTSGLSDIQKPLQETSVTTSAARDSNAQ